MKRSGIIWFLTAVVTLMMSVVTCVQAGAMRPGFDSNVLPPNDDGSTGLVPLGFTVNFFGLNFNSAYVNNNGNITFDSVLGTFTPFPLTTTGRQIIAPFFADVDTRAFSDPTRYGSGVVDGRPAWGVTWANVNCYTANTSRVERNYFQLILIERVDTGVGNFDIEFNYDQIQWETGEASGGNLVCQGGSSARVGYANGTGLPGTFYELPGSGIPGAFLDTNPTTALVNNSQNSGGVLGRYLFEAREGSILRLLNSALTVSVSGATTNTTPVSGGPAGTFRFTARFCNKLTSVDTLRGLFSRTAELTNGNSLINRTRDGGGTPPGGVGSELDFPATGQYSDGLLAPSECVDVPYEIGLRLRRPFSFFVDVYGYVVGP